MAICSILSCTRSVDGSRTVFSVSVSKRTPESEEAARLTSLFAGTSLTKAFVNHHLYGPPKPSWGVELTLFTSFLREVAAYSHLSSLTKLRSVPAIGSASFPKVPETDFLFDSDGRSFLELGSLLPTPKDGIVTPISFRVKKRGLRGFLAEADAAEDGKRHITGEWVINKRLWRRMQAEFALKKTVPQDGRVILYLHGGEWSTNHRNKLAV